MKTFLSRAVLTTAVLAIAIVAAEARPYGVSASSYGRGTKYTTARGGEAYVGPRGGGFQTANGRTGVNTVRGEAYSGPNVTAVSGRYGGAAVTSGGAAYATTRGVAPAYYRSVPAGGRTVVYGGYNCYYTGGIYYRPVFYEGATVYVVVP